MRTLAFTLLLTFAVVAVAPAANADAFDATKLPPEYIGGSCGGFHWHSGLDVEDREYPHYHYHHCI